MAHDFKLEKLGMRERNACGFFDLEHLIKPSKAAVHNFYTPELIQGYLCGLLLISSLGVIKKANK